MILNYNERKTIRYIIISGVTGKGDGIRSPPPPQKNNIFLDWEGKNNHTKTKDTRARGKGQIKERSIHGNNRIIKQSIFLSHDTIEYEPLQEKIMGVTNAASSALESPNNYKNNHGSFVKGSRS